MKLIGFIFFHDKSHPISPTPLINPVPLMNPTPHIISTTP
jgi:hypothetical protein